MVDRADGYLGVLIDDLSASRDRAVSDVHVAGGYRLWLRADNADQRLTPRGLAVGCVGRERARVFHVKQEALMAARVLASGHGLSPSILAKRGVAINQDGVPAPPWTSWPIRRSDGTGSSIYGRTWVGSRKPSSSS